MFGNNPISRPRAEDFQVKEVFRTIQGEGPYTGWPSLFVRLSGCNLRCHFCDTNFDGGPVLSPRQLAEQILETARFGDLLVFTGGEPLLQPLWLLFTHLPFALKTQIETAGTCFPKPLEGMLQARGVDIICSPKTPSLDDRILDYVSAWKYIIRANEIDPEDGLPIVSTQVPGKPARLFRPPSGHQAPVYVQPCDEYDEEKNRRNINLAAAVALDFGYRLSMQVHKIAQLP